MRGNNPANSPADSHLWYVDNGCSRHIRVKNQTTSHVASDGGSMVFENGKSGTIVGMGKIGESLSHSIDNMYLVDSLHITY